jgi:hypothetical protein
MLGVMFNIASIHLLNMQHGACMANCPSEDSLLELPFLDGIEPMRIYDSAIMQVRLRLHTVNTDA